MNSNISVAQTPWLIGMLHCPPLPGSPRFDGDIAAARDRVLSDAELLVSGGFRSLMLENFGDTPFLPGSVSPVTIAHLTTIAREVRVWYPQVELGINVLRNDGCAALAIAHAVGASFIRVNVLCGARVTDQGLIQGIAHDLVRLRSQLGATDIRILADVDVKHSAPLAARPITEEVRDAIERGHADAIIASGSATGSAIDQSHLEEAVSAAAGVPVLIGSGVNEQTAAELLKLADGAIIGSSLKVNGQATAPVDITRVQQLLAAVQ
jgi:membrane complex biogenesis BtpA family protein